MKILGFELPRARSHPEGFQLWGLWIPRYPRPRGLRWQTHTQRASGSLPSLLLLQHKEAEARRTFKL